MGDNPNNPGGGIPKRLSEMLSRTRNSGKRLRVSAGISKLTQFLRRGLSKNVKGIPKFDPKKMAEYPALFRWGILIFLVYLLSGLAANTIGLFIRPIHSPVPQAKQKQQTARTRPSEDYDAILRRNMFNVEGKIPDPFDQGLLDCLSQARPSTQRLLLHGTIVTNDDSHSVALVQEEGNPAKIAVKKDDLFFDKFTALKVDRKKLCFQVQTTQELEFIEIPEENVGFGLSTALEGRAKTDGINPISENKFEVSRNYLDKNLMNLNEILQTAKAVPYIEPSTNRFRGFLVQSIDPGSPFASLGVRQGDVLIGVNDIVLDNPGKGLEAFQKLKNSSRVMLRVMRGGQESELSYEVK
jgi:general secretion pathway protein C